MMVKQLTDEHFLKLKNICETENLLQLAGRKVLDFVTFIFSQNNCWYCSGCLSQGFYMSNTANRLSCVSPVQLHKILKMPTFPCLPKPLLDQALNQTFICVCVCVCVFMCVFVCVCVIPVF